MTAWGAGVLHQQGHQTPSRKTVIAGQGLKYQFQPKNMGWMVATCLYGWKSSQHLILLPTSLSAGMNFGMHHGVNNIMTNCMSYGMNNAMTHGTIHGITHGIT
jgi:hypothetical protein